jgi:hypothetical protein
VVLLGGRWPQAILVFLLCELREFAGHLSPALAATVLLADLISEVRNELTDMAAF